MEPQVEARQSKVTARWTFLSLHLYLSSARVLRPSMASMAGETYKIDRVQRAAARYCLNDNNFTSSVTEMLKVLNWQTLENRRIQNSLILLYKIKHNLVAVDHHHLTETKNLNFFIPYSRTRYHMNSYFPRTIRQWNSLPYSLKASSSLGEFTSGLATVTF